MNYSFKYSGEDKVRLSDLNLDLIPHVLSKSQWKKMIKKGLVFCNQNRADSSFWVSDGDSIEIKWSLYETKTAKPFPLKVEVVYEDDFMAVVNKPPGLPVSGNVFKSLQNALSSNLKRSEHMQIGDDFKTCHRLDYSTSGLVVVSKTNACRQILGAYFEERKIEKYYYAILQGALKDKQGEWVQPIHGKASKSTFKVLKEVPSLKNGWLSLVELSPKTGRTHQLRIHSAINNHCIVGDAKYGDTEHLLKGKGLFLAAYKLEFKHPITQQDLSICIDIPHKFSKLLENEERRYLKYHAQNE